MTVIAGTTTLTPIASVDTSTAGSGVSMFTLLLSSNVISAGNLFQFEYYISTEDALSPEANNFIALEDTVTTAGISNQVTIAVPSLDNVYDPATPLFVKIRAYVATDTGIDVSEWSAEVPVHNPPPKPVNPSATMVFSDLSYEMLYVEIDSNASYDLDTVKFIVSYSYTDVTGVNQWMVSEPLTGSVGANNRITLPAISFDSEESSVVYAAVNAVFSYSYLTETYYTVSQISTTVEAEAIEPKAPVLAPIDIPTDYLVYSPTDSAQQVVLKWTAPANVNIPGYEVDYYEVVPSVGGSPIDTIQVASTLLTYTYDIPTVYTDSGTLSTTFSFVVKAVGLTGDKTTSDPQTVNTFTYATEPESSAVVWANQGSAIGLVDMVVSFQNPSNIGQGEVVGLRLEVLNASGSVVYTYPSTTTYISYVESPHTYTIFLEDIATTSVGKVRIYMVNTDTNPQTDDGEILDLSGASVERDYEESNVPFIYDVVRNTANGLTFKVLTQTPLVKYNQLIGEQAASPYLFGRVFRSEPQTYPDGNGGSYTVTEGTVTGGDANYTFAFNAQWLTNAELTGNLIISVANPVGISVEAVPAPSP